MIADIQTQDVVVLATEQDVQYVFIKDQDLVHVGGGICGSF
jgi:hypothetical protein